MRLKDKVVIVTGGAKGIAKGMAYRFAREGASVVLADLEEGTIKKNAAEIESMDEKALAAPMNVTDEWPNTKST